MQMKVCIEFPADGNLPMNVAWLLLLRQAAVSHLRLGTVSSGLWMREKVDTTEMCSLSVSRPIESDSRLEV